MRRMRAKCSEHRVLILHAVQLWILVICLATFKCHLTFFWMSWINRFEFVSFVFHSKCSQWHVLPLCCSFWVQLNAKRLFELQKHNKIRSRSDFLRVNRKENAEIVFVVSIRCSTQSFVHFSALFYADKTFASKRHKNHTLTTFHHIPCNDDDTNAHACCRWDERK